MKFPPLSENERTKNVIAKLGEIAKETGRTMAQVELCRPDKYVVVRLQAYGLMPSSLPA